MKIINFTIPIVVTSLILLFGLGYILGNLWPYNTEPPPIAPAESTTSDDITYMSDCIKIKVDNYAIGNLAITGSMLPVMDKGTIYILVNEVVNIGDFAVYKKGNGEILHQIIGEQDSKWIFKGINNPIPDADLVDKSDVLYRVKAVIY